MILKRKFPSIHKPLRIEAPPKITPSKRAVEKYKPLESFSEFYSIFMFPQFGDGSHCFNFHKFCDTVPLEQIGLNKNTKPSWREKQTCCLLSPSLSIMAGTTVTKKTNDQFYGWLLSQTTSNFKQNLSIPYKRVHCVSSKGSWHTLPFNQMLLLNKFIKSNIENCINAAMSANLVIFLLSLNSVFWGVFWIS